MLEILILGTRRTETRLRFRKRQVLSPAPLGSSVQDRLRCLTSSHVFYLITASHQQTTLNRGHVLLLSCKMPVGIPPSTPTCEVHTAFSMANLKHTGLRGKEAELASTQCTEQPQQIAHQAPSTSDFPPIHKSTLQLRTNSLEAHIKTNHLSEKKSSKINYERSHSRHEAQSTKSKWLRFPRAST